MKLIVYLILGFLCLAFLPIAAPILLIVAVFHMLEGQKSKKQKRLMVEANQEAERRKHK